MPGFSTWGNSSFGSMPLTPPDYDSGYATRLTDQTYHSQQHKSQMFDAFKQYGQLPPYSAQHVFNNATSRMGTQNSAEFGQLSAFAPRLPTGSSYAADVAAPILPPIRAPDNLGPYAHYGNGNATFTQQKPKEEKPTGGVAAHLDYDIQTMSDFVAEMSQGIVNSSTPIEAQYRKYVTQILTSTRLPSSTIMLGLFYLANRVKILSAQGVTIRSRDALYCMLTTCLLLGSKFLDDNTFQNRSWAEVSNINVRELNKMELDWLQDFDWCIHGRMYDPQEGFYMWREHWLAYEKEAEYRKVKEAQKLAPLDTNVTRHRSTRKPMMSPEGPIPVQYQRKSHYDTQWVSPLVSEPSPPSVAYSGPATPEYYSSATWNYAHPSYSQSMWSSSNTAPAFSTSRSHAAYPSNASYVHQYAPSAWNTHGSGCGCTLYNKCKDHYFLSSNPYNMQTVAC